MHIWTKDEISRVKANMHLTKCEMAAEITGLFGFDCTYNQLKGVFKRYGLNSGRTGLLAIFAINPRDDEE